MDPVGLIKLTPFQFAAVVALFLPGWVSLRVDRLIHPQRDATAGQNLIEIIGYSMLNAGLLCWVLIPTATQFASPVPNFVSLVGPAILVCLVGPAFWPIGFRLAQRWAARRRWVVGPYRTAWDDFFGRRQPVWIVAHMNDGSLLGGYFGSSSVASMGNEAGHLYIEELWVLDENGKFVAPAPDSQGAILRPSDYVWIEIRRDDL